MLSKLKISAKRVTLAILFAGVLSVGATTVEARLDCYNTTEPGVIVCYSTGSSAGPYMFYYDTVRRIYW